MVLKKYVNKLSVTRGKGYQIELCSFDLNI